MRPLARREFVGVFVGVLALPFIGHAQQPERVRRVGALMPFPENDPVTRASIRAFAHGLAQSGWGVRKPGLWWKTAFCVSMAAKERSMLSRIRFLKSRYR